MKNEIASLALHYLGACNVTLNQQPISSFRSDKVRALLAYLALDARPHRREILANLFWSDNGEEYAQKNLRNTLHRLRQAFDGVLPAASEQLLISDRQTIALDTAHFTLDVQQIKHLISTSNAHCDAALHLGKEHLGKEHLAQCPDCLGRLKQAIDLYQGELLAGLSLADAPAFEEWLLIQREALHQEITLVLFDLAEAQAQRGEWRPAQHYAQRLLAMEPWREEAHRLLMRILAYSGQRSAALAQYQQCRQVLKAELNVEPNPQTTALVEAIRRGDFDKVTPMHEIGHDKMNEPSIHPVTYLPSPRVTQSQPRHNLPTALTPFVGRTHSLSKILSHLQQGVHLLTLVGAGGMGKSRLAMEVGRQQLHTYADGVWFVSLAGLRTPTLIPNTIAIILGLSIQGGDPRAALCQLLRSKRMLLILDNFEHLLGGSNEGVELVSALLQAAVGIQILVTSRERLNLRGEQLFQVQPLSLAGELNLTQASASSAVQLFVQSVQFAQADFQLTDSNLPTVLRICQLVQGMPLGLELAAAQAGVLPLRTIADEMAKSAEFLVVDWHDLPDRQRSMRTVFTWSWQLLTPEDQRVLRQISIFAGSFDLSAAKVVTSATLPLLSRLCHKSLLQWQESASGEGEYSMHELLRQFAAEELHKAGEEATVATRHGRYYLAYLATRGLRLGRNEPKEASAEILPVLDNIRKAWQWAGTQGQIEEVEQAAYAWWQFCLFQGLEAEARQSFDQAIIGVRQRLATDARGAAAALSGRRLLATLLAIYANFLFAQGRNTEMAAMAQEAIDLGGANGGIEGETLGMFVLGRALQEFDHPHEAGEQWRQTIIAVRSYLPAHPENEFLHEAHWMSHNWLRGNLLHLGDSTGSRTYIMQALQICQTLGKRRAELFCLAALADLHFLLYDFAAAERDFVAALELARTLSYRRVEVLAQLGLGKIFQFLGAYTTATRLLTESLTTAAMFAFSYEQVMILVSLIRLHCQLGNLDAASQYQEQLMQRITHVNLPKECQLYGYLAAAIKAHIASDNQIALDFIEKANQLNQQGGEILFRLVDTALILGHLRAAVGQWDAAALAFQAALTAFQQLGNRALATEPQAGLAHISLAQGDLAGALRHVEVILPILAEHPFAGYNGPFFIYATCYHVLTAVADRRAATVLQQGYDLLQQCAAKLDVETRESFLKNVPINRQLLESYEAILQ